MLRPHHREDAELGERGLAAELVEQAAIFVHGKAVLGDERRREALGGARGPGGAAHCSASTSALNIFAPSVPPSAGSARRSGCGISPSTLRVSL